MPLGWGWPADLLGLVDCVFQAAAVGEAAAIFPDRMGSGGLPRLNTRMHVSQPHDLQHGTHSLWQAWPGDKPGRSSGAGPCSGGDRGRPVTCSICRVARSIWFSPKPRSLAGGSATLVPRAGNRGQLPREAAGVTCRWVHLASQIKTRPGGLSSAQPGPATGAWKGGASEGQQGRVGGATQRYSVVTVGSLPRPHSARSTVSLPLA